MPTRVCSKGLKAKEAAPKVELNTALPDAKLGKAEELDKMGYYERARRDSVARDTAKLSFAARKMGFGMKQDEQEKKINQKLLAINQALSSLVVPVSAPGVRSDTSVSALPTAGMSKNVGRLEGLMKNMSGNKQGDAEMEQLGSMMDKLLVLQNPGLAGQLLSAMLGAKGL